MLCGAIALILLLILLAALSNPAPQTIDVGRPGDAYVLANFYRAEAGAAGDYRWSAPDSRLLLSAAYDGPLVLTLRLRAAGFAPPERWRLDLRRDGRSVVAFATRPEPRTYRVLLPPDAAPEPLGVGQEPLELTAPTARPGPADPRSLGVALDAFTVAPLPGSAPPLGPLLGRALPLAWAVALVAALGQKASKRQKAKGKRQKALCSFAPLLLCSFAPLFLCSFGLSLLALWAWRDPLGFAWGLPTPPIWLLVMGTVGVGAGIWITKDTKWGEKHETQSREGRGDAAAESPLSRVRERGTGGEGHGHAPPSAPRPAPPSKAGSASSPDHRLPHQAPAESPLSRVRGRGTGGEGHGHAPPSVVRPAPPPVVRPAPPPDAARCVPTVVLAMLAGHLLLLTPLPWRGLGALLILGAPGALAAGIIFPGERLATRAFLALCGALCVAPLLTLALQAIPGPLHGWMLVLAVDLLAGGMLASLYRGRAQHVGAGGWGEEGSGASGLRLLTADFTLLILLLGALLRLALLGSAEFQGDEARAMLLASAVVQGADGALLSHTKGPIEALLPAGILAIAGGIDELAARLPFALAGVGVLLAALALTAAARPSTSSGHAPRPAFLPFTFSLHHHAPRFCLLPFPFCL